MSTNSGILGTMTAKQSSATNSVWTGLGAMPGMLGSQPPQHKFNGIDIRITPANGGVIVSISDPKVYNVEPDIYVIHEEENLGEEINKLLTMYYLKKE